MDPLDRRWDDCKALLGRRIGAEDSAAWLEPLHLDALRADRVVLSGVPNTFFKHRILRHFRPVLVGTLAECFPEAALSADAELELRLGDAQEAPPVLEAAAGGSVSARPRAVAPPPQVEAEPRRTPGPNAAPLNPHFTLGTFLPDPANESALRFAEAVAAEPGRRFNPLLLVGPAGMGKSHLLQGIAAALRASLPEGRVVYTTGEALRNDVLDGITRRRMKPLRDHYRGAAALLVDDLDFLLLSPRAQEELLHTFDHLVGAGRQVVVSASRLPRDLEGLRDALRSRLESGLIAELSLPQRETRRALVLARARADGVALDEPVAELLATRITRSLRQLEGAVVRLGAYATLHGRAVDAAYAAEIAAPFFDAEPAASGPVPAERILERVADRFAVSVSDLRGSSRSATVAGGRRVAIHLLREVAGLSYGEIGARLGNRSHSTAIHGHRTLLSALEADPRLERTVRELVDALREHGE